MATYNKLIYDVLEVLKAHQIGDDSDIDIRHILYNINIQRADWINKSYNKPGRNVDPILIQPLGCTSIIPVDAAECCNIISGCKILRTEKKIPKPLVFNDGLELRVGSVKITNIAFSLKSVNEIPYVSFNKYAGNMMYCFYYNEYIYFVSKKDSDLLLDTVKIWGVFSDPEAADTFADCEDNCFTYDKEYPIKDSLIPYITGEVLKKFGISLNLKKDNSNNAQD